MEEGTREDGFPAIAVDRHLHIKGNDLSEDDIQDLLEDIAEKSLKVCDL